MLTKVCTICEVEKSVDEYHKSKLGIHGVAGKCKSCRKHSDAQRYHANRDVILEYNRVYREANRESMRIYHKANKDARRIYCEANKNKITEQRRIWREANKNALVEYERAYRKANPHVGDAKTAKRRARINNMILTEFDELVLREAADLRIKRSKITKTPWHIDHIVPLNHKHASGLHNGYNIQVVPGNWNIKKGNRNMDIYFNIT